MGQIFTGWLNKDCKKIGQFEKNDYLCRHEIETKD